MLRNQRLAVHTLLVASFGMLAPPSSARAAETENHRTPSAQAVAAFTVRDIELTHAGELVGSVANAQGQPNRNVEVIVLHEGDRIAAGATSQSGEFRVRLGPGTYTVVSGTAAGICRCWMHGTAPPTSNPGLTLVDSGVVVRGQHGGGIGNLLVLSAVASAAIAIPIAVHNHRKDRDPASP